LPVYDSSAATLTNDQIPDRLVSLYQAPLASTTYKGEAQNCQKAIIYKLAAVQVVIVGAVGWRAWECIYFP
jgi:hypothetical protein